MTSIFRSSAGSTPLLISVPHDGREIPHEILTRMTAAGQSIPDTDWHIAELYDFAAEIGASTVVADYSRYVVDLNRAADDAALYPGQVVTGLCPEQTFAGEALYKDGGVGDAERLDRIQSYWLPYHNHIRDTLDALKSAHGFALLWDAHSIPSNVPRLFDGELPELNLGSNSSKSCAAGIEAAVAEVATDSDYSVVVNGRFKGGYITRHYGDPDNGIHALQLEIAQRAYMDESTGTIDGDRATALRDTLKKMLHRFRNAAQE